ncbi:MAG: glutamine amidotransferase [Anaerolineae bacterium]
MELEEQGNGMPGRLRRCLQLSLRTRILIGCAVFLSVLFAAIVVGVVETAQIMGQRRGSPVGPEGWMLVEMVVRLPVDRPSSPVRDIFLNTTELGSLRETLWVEDVGNREQVRLFQAPENWTSQEGYEYVPHVIVFEDVPGDAVEPDSLEKLAKYEKEGLVGLVFFAGDLFSGGPGLASWSGSPITDILPVDTEEVKLVKGMEAGVKIKDRGFPPFKGFDFSTFPRIQAVTRVVPKPGAKVAAAAEAGGKEYPLLVWWEVKGARILVWTGSFSDIYNWQTDEFFRSGGSRGGPLFARKLVCFAAERGGGSEDTAATAGHGSFKIQTDEDHPEKVAGLRVYIDREKVKRDEEAREMGRQVWDYVFVAPGVVRPGLELGVEYVLTDELMAEIEAALTSSS